MLDHSHSGPHAQSLTPDHLGVHAGADSALTPDAPDVAGVESAPPGEDPWLGRVLDGRYRIESRLASGGFGVVYRGVQTAFDRPVAIKVLHARTNDSAEHAARFRQEARALAQLGHPGIVQVIDFGRAVDAHYLVMELLQGPTLARRLACDGPMSVERVIDLGIALLDALGTAHARGVVHRDIKPENIVVDAGGAREIVKLVDFGIAKLLEDGSDPVATQAGHLIGSPRYLSPEQASDRAITDRSDIYSLGAVLYEALVGRPAYTRRGLREYIAAHIAEAPDAAVRDGTLLRGRIVKTILRLMAKDPNERPTARQAAALLEACRGEALTEASVGRRAHGADSASPRVDFTPSTLGDEIARRRQERFVGREVELAMFERLFADDDELRILHFVGAGGIGKSTLLTACCDRARARGARVVWLDGAELANLPQLLGVSFAPIIDDPPDLLVIDRLEHAAGVVDGLRDGILPRLPFETKVLLAGRRPLGWDVHPGLRGMAVERELGAWSCVEARQLLSKLGVAEHAQASVFDEAGGHPLTLALMAERMRDTASRDTAPARIGPDGPRRLRDVPSLIHRLTRDLADHVPSPAHRRGLLAASLARRLAPDDLAAVVGADAPAIHRWIADLSCARMVESTPGSVDIHEIARRVFVAEARLHTPELVLEVIGTLGARALERMRQAATADLRRHIFDVGYIMGQLMDIPYDPVDFKQMMAPTPALPHHWPEVEAMLERFEGARAVDTLRAWRGPFSHTVVVCDGDAVLGFACGMRLDRAPADLLAQDPGTARLAACWFDERRLPRGRDAIYFRFWAGPNHHLPSRVQTWLFMHFLLLATTSKSIGALASAHHPPEFWLPLASASAAEMFTSAHFDVDGRAFLAYGQEFSTVSKRDWLIAHFERMFESRHGIGAMARAQVVA